MWREFVLRETAVRREPPSQGEDRPGLVVERAATILTPIPLKLSIAAAVKSPTHCGSAGIGGHRASGPAAGPRRVPPT
jgi:hypothetical protein